MTYFWGRVVISIFSKMGHPMCNSVGQILSLGTTLSHNLCGHQSVPVYFSQSQSVPVYFSQPQSVPVCLSKQKLVPLSATICNVRKCPH